MHTLDRGELIAGTGNPYVRIRLYDDDGDLVDLTTGYSNFRARVARKARPETAVLTIAAGVTGDTEGFLIPALAICALDTTPVYVLTAACDDSGGNPRAAQGELTINPSPL